MSSAMDAKTKPENNPWYLLATLYGQPTPDDIALRERNRRAWNRYMLQWLKDDCRFLLTKKGPGLAGDLAPLTAEELTDIVKAFTERCRQTDSVVSTRLSDLQANKIDFSGIEFEDCLFLSHAVFPIEANFSYVTFKQQASFEDALFCNLANFEGTTFSSRTDFRDVIFSSVANFAVATFSDVALFQRAGFSSVAGFNRGTFSGVTYFNGATFSDTADFRGVAFSAITHFEQANFSSLAQFQDTNFSEITFFNNATFGGMIRFANAKFLNANFKEANFSGIGNFSAATFSDLAFFDNATFSDLAQFDRATFGSSTSFVNAKMERPTSFEAATFSVEPPSFFGAKLHEGTVWRHVKWPSPPGAQAEAGRFVDAYERLKLEMDRLKKHEDELDFFALELQSRRVLAGGLRGLPIAIYGLLCDYGRSYVRPMAWLMATVLIGAALYLPHFGVSKYPHALGLSVANTFSVFGFRKDFIDPHVIESLSRFLKIVSAFQTLVGIVLFFCFGLAVRNRFRMK
jgi:hypothetical protein